MKQLRGRGVSMGVVVVTLLFLLTLTTLVGHSEASESRKFTLINLIFDGTKIWLPSTLIVQEGDAVELTLINKLDAPHGFKIADFDVETVVQPKATATIHFTASKTGIHDFTCQLHPPHIGGQILVVK